MALDKRFVGREYGPFFYEAGLEKMREFAYAVGGSIPSTGYSGIGAPPALNPVLHDDAAGKASAWGSVIGFPTFAVTFAIAPFAKACSDPELQLNLLRLVHGEQQFEFLEVVRPGDRLTTTGKITDITTKRSLDFLQVTTETKNQTGALVVRAKWTAIIRG
jgi:acyl dehydratase